MIGLNIKALRERASLSQNELAKKMRVSQPTISKWENGEIDPTMRDFYSLARNLKTDVWEFFMPNVENKPTIEDPNIKMLVAILERIPESKRSTLIKSFCMQAQLLLSMTKPEKQK